MNPIDFLSLIVTSLVSHKDDIVIERKDDDLGILLSLKVNKEDMGTIIGKE
jgi:predicted RNA-binding protein YlqC (UPF0109 family)